MKSFSEFLDKYSECQNFLCKKGMVIFKNSNSKKFVLDEDDIVSSLRLIWNSDHRLDDLLDGNWIYEERKYRAAFDKIFEGEKNNSVVTEYGSQTPNTVRALELYANYLLGTAPTESLNTPLALKHDNLALIFSDAESLFKKWLGEQKLAERSIISYINALKGIISKEAGFNVFKIIDHEDALSKLIPVIDLENIKGLNDRGNGMYKAAINNYISFLETDPFAKNGGQDTAVPVEKIPEFFETAVKDHFVFNP
jgi:hypothetical protein